MEFYESALEAVRAGSSLLPWRYGEPRNPGSIDSKAEDDYRTNLDLLVEARIRGIIHSRYPGHGIVMEEHSNISSKSRYVWYLDPIDGTRNLIAGRPEIATSLALYENDNPLIGVIGMPLRNWDLV